MSDMRIDIGIEEADRLEIAERIRALGAIAPGSHDVLSALSTIPEKTAWMLRSLLDA